MEFQSDAKSFQELFAIYIACPNWNWQNKLLFPILHVVQSSENLKKVAMF